MRTKWWNTKHTGCKEGIEKTFLLKFIVSAKHEIHNSFTEICLKLGIDLFQSITWIQCCFFLQANWKEIQRIFNSLKIALQYYHTPATEIHVCGRYGREICGIQFTGWLPNVYRVTSAPIFTTCSSFCSKRPSVCCDQINYARLHVHLKTSLQWLPLDWLIWPSQMCSS